MKKLNKNFNTLKMTVETMEEEERCACGGYCDIQQDFMAFYANSTTSSTISYGE